MMFATVFVVFRLFGKRMLALMTPIDRVSYIAYGTIAGSTAITKPVPLYAGVLAVLGFAILAWVVGRMARQSEKMRTLLMGRPEILVKNGVVDETQLHRAGMQSEDLVMRLRELQIGNVNEIQLAQLEPDGKLGLLKRSSTNPSSASLRRSVKFNRTKDSRGTNK